MIAVLVTLKYSSTAAGVTIALLVGRVSPLTEIATTVDRDRHSDWSNRPAFRKSDVTIKRHLIPREAVRGVPSQNKIPGPVCVENISTVAGNR